MFGLLLCSCNAPLYIEQGRWIKKKNERQENERQERLRKEYREIQERQEREREEWWRKERQRQEMERQEKWKKFWDDNQKKWKKNFDDFYGNNGGQKRNFDIDKAEKQKRRKKCSEKFNLNLNGDDKDPKILQARRSEFRKRSLKFHHDRVCDGNKCSKEEEKSAERDFAELADCKEEFMREESTKN